MRLAFALTLALVPAPLLAAGSGSSTAPKPSETTTTCAEGLVFDLATQTCMSPEDSTNDDSAMMDAVRELAHFGRLADAARVLDQMSDQQDDLVLTYRGFITRKLGDMEGGMAFYAAALTQNPDNILARSYMGQAYVELGETEMAQAQLSEIRARGGRGTWAEFSLRQAVGSGVTYTY